MNARDAIFTKIRNARDTGRAQLASAGDAGPAPMPASRTSPGADELLEQFIDLVQAEAATVDELAAVADVPLAVARYIKEQGIAERIVLGPDPQLRSLDWQAAASLKCSDGPPHADGDTVITGCYAAVADSAALVVVSSPNHPVELNFLPANQIVVLHRERVLADFEELWGELRRDYASQAWPRCINLIVGPSRTADLGFPPKLGAHGPGRVHILIV